MRRRTAPTDRSCSEVETSARREHVTVPVHRMDEPRPMRLLFDFFSEPGNRFIDGSSGLAVGRVPDDAQQLFSRHDAVGPFGEVAQDLKLPMREAEVRRTAASRQGSEIDVYGSEL